MRRHAKLAGWPVQAGYTTALPVSPSQAWRTLRQFERVVCRDHFHREVRLRGAVPAAGVAFDLPHGPPGLPALSGLTVERHGRILRWREGRGYAFSDLPRRASGGLFPHVFELRLAPLDEAAEGGGCRLTLEVKGRWTVPRLPRPLAAGWVRWNTWSMGAAIARLVLADALRARRRERRATAAGSAG